MCREKKPQLSRFSSGQTGAKPRVYTCVQRHEHVFLFGLTSAGMCGRGDVPRVLWAGSYLLLDLDLLVVLAGTWLRVPAQAAEPGGGAASRVGTAHLMAEAIKLLKICLLGENMTTAGANILPLIFQHLQHGKTARI